MNKDTQQGYEVGSTNDVELTRKPCCCGMSKTGFCDGTHVINEHSHLHTEEITLQETIDRYGHLLTVKELNALKNLVQPQQFQHPFGGDHQHIV